MGFEIDPNLIENDEVRITTDGNGDLALEHKASNRTITLDRDISLLDLTTADEASDAAPVQSVNGRDGVVSGLFESDDYDPEGDTHDRYTDEEAEAAAPVQSVNEETGDVAVPTGELVFDTISFQDSGDIGILGTADPESIGDVVYVTDISGSATVEYVADGTSGETAECEIYVDWGGQRIADTTANTSSTTDGPQTSNLGGGLDTFVSNASGASNTTVEVGGEVQASQLGGEFVFEADVSATVLRLA